MGFLDDLKKKTEQFTLDVTTKTQQGLDMMKLNTAIATEEKKIKELYTQIGEQYWRLNNDNPQEGFFELINAVNASKQIIEEYRTLRSSKQERFQIL